MEKIELGSLYFDKTSVDIGSEYHKGSIMIGNTNHSKPLSWIKYGNLMLADHNICTNISWKDLDSFGFIFGCPIMIDGQRYLCRSLRLDNQVNEWNMFLDKFGDSDDIWHWKNIYSWGQGLHNWDLGRTLFGHSDSRTQITGKISLTRGDVGFRPILETLSPILQINNSHIGTKFEFRGRGGCITGELSDFTEYDFVLRSVTQPPKYKWSYCLQDGSVIIDRKAIFEIKRV